MSTRLTDDDEGLHPAGNDPAWNESRYVDVFDRANGVSAWLRVGNRSNEGRAEVSTCVGLPDGRCGFMFGREDITASVISTGGQEWTVEKPFRTSRVTFDGEVLLLDDPWLLTEPKRAFLESQRLPCRIDLTSTAFGLDSVLGADQGDIERIFLRGQATAHYQHLTRTTGTVAIGDESWSVNGRGGRDHSWGPRHWHAKVYFRWLIAAADDDLGFMLTRAVGPTKQTRSGFVWDHGVFFLVDDFVMRNTYAGAPHYEVRGVEVEIRSGERTWSAAATPQTWVPLRHVQPVADGASTTLRIVKSAAIWVIDGTDGVGMLEYHDRMDGGLPAGLAD